MQCGQVDTKHGRALQHEDVGSIGGLSLDGAEILRCYHSFVNECFLINGRTMEGGQLQEIVFVNCDIVKQLVNVFFFCECINW